MSTLLESFIQQNPVFRREQLLDHLAVMLGRKQAARRLRGLLGYQLKVGTIQCLRHGLYAVQSLGRRKPSPYLIAGRAAPDAVIGFQAALTWHLRAGKHPPRTIHIYASGIRADQAGIRENPLFVPVKAQNAPASGTLRSQGIQVIEVQGCAVKVTTVERTIVDVLDRPDLASRPNVVWAALNSLSAPLKVKWIASYLRRLNCASTTAKVGYFLSGNLRRFGLKGSDLRALPDVPQSPHPWVKGARGAPHPVWNIVVPHARKLPDAEAFNLGSLFGGARGASEVRLNGNRKIEDINLLIELGKRFGPKYKMFRPGQEPVIRAVLEGRDALAILPTGAGKSLTYQFPAMLLNGLTLVVSPLLSLMEDQVREARVRKLHAVALKSTWNIEKSRSKGKSRGRSKKKQSIWATPRQISRRLAQGRLDLLFVSPESLGRLAEEMPHLGEMVTQVVVDEAHLIETWGRKFREEYRNLGVLRSYCPKAPILALTATATTVVRDRIIDVLGFVSGQFVEQRVSIARKNLHLRRWKVEDASFVSRYRAVVAFLEEGIQGPGIIYCSTRNETKEIAIRLRKSTGERVRFYHAGLTKAKRQAVQNAFLVRNSCRVVVATVAFGMGVNKQDIRWVIHFGLPSSLESYVQEIGRAGRDGRPAECLLVFSQNDQGVWRRRIRGNRENLDPRIDPKTLWLDDQISRAELKDMVRFAWHRGCLHKFIGKHFSDHQKPCGIYCDYCKPRPTSAPWVDDNYVMDIFDAQSSLAINEGLGDVEELTQFDLS